MVPEDCVPGGGRVAEVGFVGHVAGERGVVAEDGVFGDRAVLADGFEESVEVRLQVVPGIAREGEPIRASVLFPAAGSCFSCHSLMYFSRISRGKPPL